ncbi:MAG: hypothetical protein IT462_02705 [Planctomycetes bacterium]|nr:hypothetical protein [Planctomycetota bacterium]
MGKLVIVSVLALFLGACASSVKENASEKPLPERTPEKTPEKPVEPEVDLLKPYRVKGNTWTVRWTSTAGDKTTVAYTKCEVLEVKEHWAEVKQTKLDADKRETVSSVFPEAFVTSVDEKIKVEAGEFDCVRQDGALPDYSGTLWRDKKWGLAVKSINRFGASTMIQELTEIKAEGEAKDKFSIYRTVGNYWIQKTTTGGKNKEVLWARREVVEVSADKAVILYYEYDDQGNKLSSEIISDEFFATTSIEKVTVPAGEFECVKTAARDGRGFPTAEWVDRKTGVTVKSEAKTDAWIDVTELVEISVK